MVLSKDRKSDIVNLYSYFEAERKSGKLRTRLDRTIQRVAEALKIKYKMVDYVCKSKRKAMNRNWYNQKANPALNTKAGNK